jgi:hypothetical protein
MAPPRKKFKCQGKVTADNQQVNVVANEEEIEVEQKIIIYTPTFKSLVMTLFILHIKIL